MAHGAWLNRTPQLCSRLPTLEERCERSEWMVALHVGSCNFRCFRRPNFTDLYDSCTSGRGKASGHSNCFLDVPRSPTDTESTVEGELISEEEWSDDSWKSPGYIAQERRRRELKAKNFPASRQRHNNKLRLSIAKLKREIEAHTSTLERQQWGQICNSLNGQLGCEKTWHLLRHLLHPGNTKSAARNQLTKIIHQYPGTDAELLAELASRYINTSSQSDTHLPHYVGAPNEQLDADMSVAENTHVKRA
ncbi:hypothetical protein HPB49_008039 [Dermacentor silvarum]|uniref:Uncharacterized protein n=1 Tax=Dermacentor silvarum TaxID=543639 RepID=A0ACB8DN72_DERSI|nr:hypothetical protein HPB49_008039 [Dermacentor silvarum]